MSVEVSKQRPGSLVDVEGSVKWFDPRKGFGFIVGPEGQDIFCHYTAINGDGFRVLKDGSRVRYSAEESDKGWKATSVTSLEAPRTPRTARVRPESEAAVRTA